MPEAQRLERLADQVAAPAKTSTPTQTAAADVSITASLTTASINTTSNGTDGSTTSSRLYVATNTAGTWTPVTTAA